MCEFDAGFTVFVPWNSEAAAACPSGSTVNASSVCELDAGYVGINKWLGEPVAACPTNTSVDPSTLLCEPEFGSYYLYDPWLDSAVQ